MDCPKSVGHQYVEVGGRLKVDNTVHEPLEYSLPVTGLWKSLDQIIQLQILFRLETNQIWQKKLSWRVRRQNKRCHKNQALCHLYLNFSVFELSSTYLSYFRYYKVEKIIEN